MLAKWSISYLQLYSIHLGCISAEVTAQFASGSSAVMPTDLAPVVQAPPVYVHSSNHSLS